MRDFIILSLLFVGAFCNVTPQNYADDLIIDPYVFEDLINSTIEDLRPKIPDPLKIDDLNISFPQNETTSKVIAGDASISNFRLNELQGFELTALKLALIGLELNATVVFPVIDLITDYDLNITIIELIPIYGLGTVSVRIEGLEIAISAGANLTSGISLHDLGVQLYIDNAKFDLHGLLNDEDLSQLISAILNDLVVPFLDENQDFITSIISPIIEEIINALLGNTVGSTATPMDPRR